MLQSKLEEVGPYLNGRCVYLVGQSLSEFFFFETVI